VTRPPVDTARALAAQIASNVLGARPTAVTSLGGGQVGRAFRVDAGDRASLIKLVRTGEDPSFEAEAVDDRVYGNRFGNLQPCHALLTRVGIPTPALHAVGRLPAESLSYAVFDFLEGEPDDFSPAWFTTVGAALRELHRVRRGYQGWVGLAAPLAETWAAAFARALALNLERARPLLPAPLARRAEALAAEAIDEPAEFVLSHTDGFQGVLAREGARWRLLGHIDIEDFQFTDRHFVLAGFELGHAISDRPVFETFWRAYDSVAAEDPRYRRLKPLFHLLYISVWARVFRNDPPLLQRCLDELARVLG
jgi:hypothetical protein